MRFLATLTRATLLCALAPAASAGQAISFRTSLPRTLVCIQERDGSAARDLVAHLREQNFPLIDGALVRAATDPRLVERAVAGDLNAALELGRGLGAQVLIVGTARPKRADAAGGRPRTASADLELRAIRLDGGAVIATERTRGSGQGASEPLAGNAALRAAMLQLLDETQFISAIAENWTREPWLADDYFAARPLQFMAPPGVLATTVSVADRIAQKWAVIIGVSDYRAEEIFDLQSAARDARAMHDFLTSSAAGPFQPDHVMLLTDSQATAQAVRAAVFVFLQNARPEDLVLIYFAGHGGVDPANPANVYLLPHDADVKRLAATGFPLWDLRAALRHRIKAERILVIADAAHPGGTPLPTNPIHEAFAQLFTSQRGLVLTASAANELSEEAAPAETELGAFTYSLIQGLNGAADANENGAVTFAEVSDYVARRVSAETQGRQSPQRMGVGDLPLANVTLISRAATRLK